MADRDGRDESGSSSEETKMEDSQLENQNQKPAGIDNPTASGEEEAREHQEAEQTLQETNRASSKEEDANRDAATEEEKEEIINEDGEKRKTTDHEATASCSTGCETRKKISQGEDGSGVVKLFGVDLSGARTEKASVTMMGSGSEVGGGVSESASAEQHENRSFSSAQASGGDGKAHRKPATASGAEQPKIWTCSPCNKSFTNQHAWAGHQNAHGKPAEKHVQIWRCETCHMTFKSLWELPGHEKAHRKPAAEKPEKGVRCNICGRQFPDKRGFWSHELKHKRDQEEQMRADAASLDHNNAADDRPAEEDPPANQGSPPRSPAGHDEAAPDDEEKGEDADLDLKP